MASCTVTWLSFHHDWKKVEITSPKAWLEKIQPRNTGSEWQWSKCGKENVTPVHKVCLCTERWCPSPLCCPSQSIQSRRKEDPSLQKTNSPKKRSVDIMTKDGKAFLGRSHSLLAEWHIFHWAHRNLDKNAFVTKYSYILHSSSWDLSTSNFCIYHFRPLDEGKSIEMIKIKESKWRSLADRTDM